MTVNCEEDIIAKVRSMTWYSAVDFGNGIIARTNQRSSYLIGPDSIYTGEGKWNYIIRRNLPNLQGKRVLDLGCNNGIMCIMAARAGATEVVGVDSCSTWKEWMEQAEFVKEALEWRCKTRYPISYIDSDMRELPRLGLGRFDVVMILCCLYYLSDDDIAKLLSYLQMNTRHVIIQCNISGVHPRATNRRATPAYMVSALEKAGFKYVYVDKPLFYPNPVVVATDRPFKKNMVFGFRSALLWLREKI